MPSPINQLIHGIQDVVNELAGRALLVFSDNTGGHLLTADIRPLTDTGKRAAVQIFVEDSGELILRVGESGLLDWEFLTDSAVSDVLDLVRAAVMGKLTERVRFSKNGEVLGSTTTAELPHKTVKFTHRASTGAPFRGRYTSVNVYQEY